MNKTITDNLFLYFSTQLSEMHENDIFWLDGNLNKFTQRFNFFEETFISITPNLFWQLGCIFNLWNTGLNQHSYSFNNLFNDPLRYIFLF